jgi:hypothetical protein
MIYAITWTKDGYTNVTYTASGETIAMKYALMRESQGYVVDIDTCSEETLRNAQRLALRRTVLTA